MHLHSLHPIPQFDHFFLCLQASGQYISFFRQTKSINFKNLSKSKLSMFQTSFMDIRTDICGCRKNYYFGGSLVISNALNSFWWPILKLSQLRCWPLTAFINIDRLTFYCSHFIFAKVSRNDSINIVIFTSCFTSHNHLWMLLQSLPHDFH